MAGQTKTPWVAREGTTTGAEVVAKKPRGGDYVVARCGGKDREANAAFIVRAVNSHDQMLAALNEALEITKLTWTLKTKIKAAIAAASPTTEESERA